MSSDAQINANRINAQSSTGPSSTAGRKKVSMNALKHNFCGQTCIVLDHEIEDYGRLFAAFRKEFRPVGPSEEFLVQSLSELTWTTQQIRAAMASKMSLGSSITDPRSEAAPTPEIADAIAKAANLNDILPSLNTLGIYEARKTRLFMAVRKELIQIQAARKAAEQEERDLAVALRKNDLETRQPDEPEWDPKENGFVYSIAQLDDLIAQDKRFARLKKAAA
jgi:hypothetical protein